jgi:hypothetical protein
LFHWLVPRIRNGARDFSNLFARNPYWRKGLLAGDSKKLA